MLTGRETIATAFAETAHRDRRRPAAHHREGQVWRTVRWGDLAARVRLLTLGLADDGVSRGEQVSLDGLGDADRWAVGLATVCAGAALAIDGRVVNDLDRLASRGAAIDAAEPDRFETLRGAVSPDDDAFVEGEVHFTGANLLWAAASLAAALAVDADDRLVTTLDPTTATGWVVSVLVPVVTASSSCLAADDVVHAVAVARPTLLVVGDREAGILAEAPNGGTVSRSRRRSRRARVHTADATTGRPAGLEDVRNALVVGGGQGGRRLAGRGVPARPAVAFSGHAGLVTGARGRPLPGVSVGIADDGEVLVRSEAVAPARCADGWLHTGRRGELDRTGTLTLAAG